VHDKVLAEHIKTEYFASKPRKPYVALIKLINKCSRKKEKEGKSSCKLAPRVPFPCAV
jgi:hypothetical protein